MPFQSQKAKLQLSAEDSVNDHQDVRVFGHSPLG